MARHFPGHRLHAATGVRIALHALLGWVLLFVAVGPAWAAITLSEFKATPGDGEVLIEWETQTELDNAGFYVLRSEEETSNYEIISDFIEAVGTGDTGASYSYRDQDVTNGVTYYYKLQSIGNDQSIQEDGPIEATPNAATATPTETEGPTPTATKTPTVTATDQPPTDVPTATDESYPGPPTRVPTATRPSYPAPATTAPPTAYPGPATSTPPRAATATLPATAALTATPFQATSTLASLPLTVTVPTSPTATLMPFPTVTLEFPATAVSAAVRPDQTQTTVNQGSNQRGLSRYIPLGFILLIWLLLGVWFYISSRTLE